MKTKEIYPLFDQLVQKKEKEKLLNQVSHVFWFTGLSGSGKTTLAKAVEKKLFNQNFLVQVLDGDNIRAGINNNLGFSSKDRLENIRRIAEISKLFLNSGIITINCFISPSIESRELAKKIIGKEYFHEIYINASYNECEKRDVKGLYKKAKDGKIKNFTGLDLAYEKPTNPHLIVNTEILDIETSTEIILEYILSKIKYK